MLKNLGYACLNETLRAEGIFTNRTVRKVNFSKSRACELIYNNSSDLEKIIQWNLKNNIGFFRISSDIFPFWDHPELQYDLEDLLEFNPIMMNLLNAGTLAEDNEMKLETHPGPYNCLASPHKNVVDKTILCLEKHSKMIDYLVSDDTHVAINIHVGGSYGDHKETAKRFCKNFYRLSSKCRNRLVIENDDKINGWSVKLLYKMIFKEIGTPLTFDYHHHKFCPGDMDAFEAANICRETWEIYDLVPTIHYSESRDPNKEIPAHSEYIEDQIPMFYYNPYDIMIEAKAKELALLKYRETYHEG